MRARIPYVQDVTRGLARGALLAGLLLLGAPGASALGLADVDLKSFPTGGVNSGFTNAGPGFDWVLTPSDRFLCAGAVGSFVATTTGPCAGRSAYQLTVTQQLQEVHQFPQARGATPSATDPFIADSLWTVRNATSETFTDPVLLMFTNVVLTPFPGALVPGGYPNLAVGLDGNLLDIVRYQTATRGYFFGAANLGPLAPGEEASFLVRYVVSSGPMPLAGHDYVMPPLALIGVAVPEAGTLSLIGVGLLGLAAAGRRRS